MRKATTSKKKKNTTYTTSLGQFLAVGWSDGFVRLMGLENNKAAHHLKVGDTPGNKITHIGWASSSITDNGSDVVNRALGNSLGDGSAINGDSLPLDLPRELTFLEVDTALPKISPLPNSSAGSGYVPNECGQGQHTDNSGQRRRVSFHITHWYRISLPTPKAGGVRSGQRHDCRDERWADTDQYL